MVRKEIPAALISLEQLKEAIRTLLEIDEKDYRFKENGDNAIRLLCRTGYSWDIDATIKLDIMTAEEQEPAQVITIACSAVKNAPITKQLQQEYSEKYAAQLAALIMQYIDQPQQPKKKKGLFHFGVKKRLTVL